MSAINGKQNSTASGAQTGGRHRGTGGQLWVRCLLWWELAWWDFLYLVMPGECVVCGRDDAALCRDCARLLRQQCATPYRAESSADALVSAWGQVLLPVVAAGVYRDATSVAILAFKNHGRTSLGSHLGRALAGGLDALPQLLPNLADRELVLVPVPSSGASWRRRGYDPVALMLRAIAREHRLPAGMQVIPALAVKMRPPWRSRRQKSLGRAARRANVRNTLRMRGNLGPGFRRSANLAGALVVVVDDVLTTGSTLAEATKTLEKAGAIVCAAVVLAAARAPDQLAAETSIERHLENIFVQKMNIRMR
ncbi:ComF family protein [Arthrobacter sp. GMC3]|uniref:ComF family protein n=1 Tax=Arthrobacter sp. GMC3 TaxID=2058894 RepID=UPI0015E41675|nr:phosphoribosyltransferase family protein [Arthrobacter sp. GMC3]